LFETTSGLKVNLVKSNLILVGNVEVGSLADTLGCGVATLSVKYVGLSLGPSDKSIHIWAGVIEKIKHRLASWKMLSFPRAVESPLSRVPSPIYPRTFCPYSLYLQCVLRSYNGIFYGGLVKSSNVTW
jgi:hypothetical protein